MAALAQQTLEVLSGHDVPSLLTHLLTRPSNASSLQACIDHLQLPIIDAVKQASERAPDHMKPTFLSLLAPSLSNAQLTSLAVHASSRSLAHARSHARQHGAGSMPPKPIQPASKQPIPAHVQTELRQFLIDHSQPAANRTGKERCGKDQPAVPIYQQDGSVAELYRQWKKKEEGEERRAVVYSTFRKEVRKMRIFKQARKKTDMCDVCVTGEEISKEVERAMQQHEEGCMYAERVKEQLKEQVTTDCHVRVDEERRDGCECGMEEESKKKERSMCRDVNVYREHRWLVKKQRELFHEEENGLKVGHAQLIMDFKENVYVNRGPVEVGQTYYNRSMRSVMGCRLVWRDKEGEMHTEYIDYVSTVLNKDAAYAIDCLNAVVSDHVLPAGMTHLSLWTDAGSHFRCAEFAHAVLVGVCSHLTGTVEWNMWLEKHGKSPVDAHFSLLSRWLKEEESHRTITSTQQLVQAWTDKAHTHAAQSPIHFHILSPPCGHDHEQTMTQTTDNRAIICHRPPSSRVYLDLPYTYFKDVYHISTVLDHVKQEELYISTSSLTAATASSSRRKGGRMNKQKRKQNKKGMCQKTNNKRIKEEEPPSNNNNLTHASTTTITLHTSDLPVLCRVLNCSTYPAWQVDCIVRCDSSPSSIGQQIQVAPRVKTSIDATPSLSTRLHSAHERRQGWRVDSDGDVIMEQQDTVQQQSTEAEEKKDIMTVPAVHSHVRPYSPDTEYELNFTCDSSALLSFASVACSSHHVSSCSSSVPVPVRARPQRNAWTAAASASASASAERENDELIAMMMQQDENARARIMFD